MLSTALSRTSAAFDTLVSDASNVPSPGQSASPVTGTTIDVPVTRDAENFIDNYDLDAEGGNDYTLCQKMVHYCGGHIVTEYLPACKAVLVFHAGCAICKLSSIFCFNASNCEELLPVAIEYDLCPSSKCVVSSSHGTSVHAQK
jgi:hypothetical protein